MSIAKVYLRSQCLLPPDIDLEQSSVGEGWNEVPGISGYDLNDRVLKQGWHCLWISGQHSRTGIGRSRNAALLTAILAALHAVPASWNAAEIDSISSSSYMAFCVARVTIHARQIQKGHVLATRRPHGKAMHAA